jgi:hypothetical protein
MGLHGLLQGVRDDRKDVGRNVRKKEFPSNILQILARAKDTDKSISRPSTKILRGYW